MRSYKKAAVLLQWLLGYLQNARASLPGDVYKRQAVAHSEHKKTNNNADQEINDNNMGEQFKLLFIIVRRFVCITGIQNKKLERKPDKALYTF